MKVTQAVLFLALIGGFSAHADLPAGQTNCQAALDGATADKQAQAKTEVNRVYPKVASAQPAPSSTGTGKAGR